MKIYNLNQKPKLKPYHFGLSYILCEMLAALLLAISQSSGASAVYALLLLQYLYL